MRFVTETVLVLLPLLCTLETSLSFTPRLLLCHRPTITGFGRMYDTSSLSLSSSDGNGDDVPKSSRIEGNQRLPTANEVEVMDEMITKLANAKPYELPNAVRRAFRVISSPQFFLRIAALTDQAKDEMEKSKYEALASNLVATLEAVVETTEEKLDERAKEVEMIVKAAAEPETGEFLVPLLPKQIDAMRKEMENLEPTSMDEGFLSTIDTWMNKSHQDGMDGMVGILQKVLQMYSGIQILKARDQANTSKKENNNDDNVDGDDEGQQQQQQQSDAAILFDNLMKVDTELWDAEIRKGIETVKPTALIGEIQRTMETVVLGLENGSMAQRVQAEYLRELVTRAEAVQTAE